MKNYKNKDIETFEKLHNKPISKMTRRDLLGAGLIQFTASMTLPTILGMMAKSEYAQAQEILCPKGGNASLVPIVNLNLAGGAGLAANFVPHDQGLQPLSSYTKLGLGTSPNFQYAFANNAPFNSSGNGSQILAGIMTELQGTTIANNTVFAGVPVRSRDDSSENKFNMDGLIQRAGRDGFILPNLGVNRNNFALAAPPTPLNVRSFNDVAGALSVSGTLGTLNSSQQSKLFKLITDLSSKQARDLASLSGGQELNKLVQCATRSNSELVGGDNSNLDPAQNQAIADIWGIDMGTNRGSRDYIFASLVYNVLQNNSASANLNMGGYDYHNGTRTTGDERDNNAGVMIGKILRTFAAMNKKAFLTVTTDGGVTGPSNEADGVWTSDRGSAGCLYMIAYDPAKAPEAKSFQLGHFNQGQGADESFITSGTVEKAIAGMFANYLSFSGQTGLIEKALPRVFSNEDLDKVLIFAA